MTTDTPAREAPAENPLAQVAALTLPDAVTMSSRASRVLGFIRDFQIANQDDYALAAEELRDIKARAKTIEDQRTGITGPINKALKAINDLFRPPSEALAEAERILKNKMITWDTEQQRIAAEARRKAEEAAAQERARLAAEAAKREREAHAAAAQAQAAADAGNHVQADLLASKAQEAQAQALTVATEAQLVMAAPVVQEAPKVKGLSTRTTIDYEVTELHALIKHVAEHPELVNLLAVDAIKLRAYVRGLGLACRLPGVMVRESKSLASRG